MAERSNKAPININIGLSAAALQDHLVKSFNVSSDAKNVSYSLPTKSKRKSYVKRMVKSNDNKIKKKTHKFEFGSEYVLRNNWSKQNESLAEKLGLLDITSGSKINERQWNILKKKALLRNEFIESCSICKDFYTFYREQILLSCSHTFHKKCLMFFERFSGKKSCPLCRVENYEARIIYDGAFYTMNKSATKIQSYWRGYIARKMYFEIAKNIIPKDERLRRKYFNSKFLDLSSKLIHSYEEHSKHVSELVESINDNIHKNKEVMKELEHANGEKVIEKIQVEAIKRECTECPICLSLFNRVRQIVLLSCSHIFHKTCLMSYEKYCCGKDMLCPLCRKHYEKYNCI